jgi:hypothetical protein
VKGTIGGLTQRTASATLQLIAVQTTTGEPTLTASATQPKILIIAAVMLKDLEKTILAVQLATKLAAIPTMTNNAKHVFAHLVLKLTGENAVSHSFNHGSPTIHVILSLAQATARNG